MTTGLALLSTGFKRLRRPPFALLTVLALLVWIATRSVTALDGTALLSLMALTAVTAYVHIAAILAVLADDPDTSVDTWIRAAFARRCFWRFIFAGLLSLLLILAGAVALLIPSFLIGAAVYLASQSAVAERTNPIEAVRRSIEVSRVDRWAVGFVFSVTFWIPLLLLQVGFRLGWHETGAPWVALEGITVIVELLGVIALTEFYKAHAHPVRPDEVLPS